MVAVVALAPVWGTGCGDDKKPTPAPDGGGMTDAPVTGDTNTDVPTTPTDGPIDMGGGDTVVPPDGGGGQLPAPMAKVIGPAGGSIVYHGGRFTVIFPRGSLSRPTEVEVSALATPPGGALGTVYQIEPAPEPLAVGKPAQVVFKFGAEIGGASGNELRIGRFAEAHWNDLSGNHVNANISTVSSDLTALGTVGLLAGVCRICTTTCDATTCAAGGGKCWDFGNGCKKCVPVCDNDGDGFCTGGAPSEPRSDCRDNNINISPDSPEICGNSEDENCDEHIDEGCRACTSDANCATVGKESCEGGFCKVCQAACDPATCAFGADMMAMPPDPGVAGKCFTFAGGACSRCVPTCDQDGDGFCPEANPGHNQQGGDCNDTNREAFPGAPEVCGNGVDDDCNGYIDDKCDACDGDTACPRQGFACVNAACEGCKAACDPNVPTCKVAGTADPGADGKCVAFGTGCSRCVPKCDGDGDGFCPGNPADPLLAGLGGDCDDQRAEVYPGGGATEICGNNLDDNCNDHVDESCSPCNSDTDCDKGGEACVDGVCNTCPTSCNPDTCRFGGDGTPTSGVAGRCVDYGHQGGCSKCVQTCDQDADGFCPGVDSPDGTVKGGDCNDMNPAINKDAVEVCGNGVDDDCDGLIDEACLTCVMGATCGGNESCSTQK
jgi:hypothetical protein